MAPRFAQQAPTASNPDSTGQSRVPFFHGRSSPLETRLFDDAADGRLDDFSPFAAALVAGGVDQPKALPKYEKLLASLAAELRRSGKVDGTPQQKARAIFEFMHRRLLHGGYAHDATNPAAVLQSGRYNCVSGSVIFNCLAREFGLAVRGLELPGHAMSRVILPQGHLDVETTCVKWFELLDDPKRQAQMVSRAAGREVRGDRSQAREVSPVQMAAMIYYNRGVALLAEKHFEQAAVANAKALRLDPASASARGNLLATINNWSIDLGNRQQFSQAADLLLAGLAFEPSYATFEPNYVHVQHQWVEHYCDAEDYPSALDVLDAARAKLPHQAYFGRAVVEVYRRWAGSLLTAGETDAAFLALNRARDRYGDAALESLVAAVNDHALELLQQQRYPETLVLLDRGLTEVPEAALLRENRRVAVMRWAEIAFRQGDYAEAIRRTTHGARPNQLHASLAHNVRWGYQKWIASLRVAGQHTAAEQVAQRALADPYLRQ